MAVNTLILPAPAKINHFLHVTGKRADGYHTLHTLFQFLDHSDTLHFSLREDSHIVLTGLDLPLEENLIYRAAQLLKKVSDIDAGITIHIEKILPLGAGLGGGSSNAATTLVALNKLWQLQLTDAELSRLGLQLGADVPIFLHGQSAFAEGIGEQLTSTDLAECWFLVAIPAVHISTGAMFAQLDLTRKAPSLKMGNDFEPLVRQCYPAVDEVMNLLSNYCNPRLSGTGASIFASFSTLSEAKTVAKWLPQNVRFFVARGVNRSPLMKTIGVSPSGKALGFDLSIPRFES